MNDQTDEPSQPDQVPQPPKPEQPGQPEPPGGWYADPHEPGRLRYWDGSTWTEYVNEQVPFAPPIPAAIAARNAGPGDGSVNDIGEWLRSSFRVAVSKLLPALLLLLLPLIPFAIVAFMMFRVVASASEVADEALTDGLATTESFFTSDFDFTSLIILGVASVLGVVLLALVQVALAHLMHRAHLDRPGGFGRALGVGLTKGWRLLGWYLVFGVVMSIATAVGVGLVFLSAQLSNGLAFAVGALLYLAVIVLSIVFGVRLVMLPVACAVAPSGSNALSATLAATKGRFLAVFGRLLLVGLLSYLVVLPFQMVAFGLFPNMIDRQPLDEIDPEAVNPSELFEPLLTAFGVLMVLYAVASLLYQIFYTSAIARLYADLGGLDSET